MSMSAQHKVYVGLEGEWTEEPRELLRKALEWWTTNHHTELDFLGEWEILPEETDYGPFFGPIYGGLSYSLEDAVNGEEEGELAKRTDFDASVHQKLLAVMHTRKLKIIFSEYTGYAEGTDEEGMDEEDCWDWEPTYCTLSSDGTQFIINEEL